MKPNDLKLNESLKLLFKTSLFVFVGILFSKIFLYSYRIIIARYFGAEIYGLFSLSIIIIGFFAIFSIMGLAEGVKRYISFYRGGNEIKKIRYLVEISSKILLFSTLVMSLISFFSAEYISINLFHNPGLIIFLKIFSFMLPFQVFSSFFLSIMVSFEKVKQVSFIQSILSGAVKLGAIILLIF